MTKRAQKLSNRGRTKSEANLPAVLFDLDGTLLDSVYQHVTAWSEALLAAGISFSRWMIHRRVGMSGKSFLQELLRDREPNRRDLDLKKLEKAHDEHFFKILDGISPLPGANELLAHLSKNKVRGAIATTGNRKQTARLLKKLRVPAGMAILTGDDVKRAKPSPDIFVAAAERLGVPIGDCIVIGDSVWDLLAAGRKSALGIGLLSGGYGQDELERAGAFRVYSDPAELLKHIEQLGLPGK
jgi:HAD superfamily hydrolase (TIGR01509 family)